MLLKAKEYLLLVLRWVPIVAPLLSFRFSLHVATIIKAFFIWLFATSPIFITAILSPIPAGQQSLGHTFLENVLGAFSISEQYVYVAAFMSPFLYMLFEKFIEADQAASFGERLKRSYTATYNLFLVYWSVAAFIFVISVVTYASTKISFDIFQNTLLYKITYDKAYFIYLASLYFWYLSLLDAAAPASNFVEQNRNAEKAFALEFDERVTDGDAG